MGSAMELQASVKKLFVVMIKYVLVGGSFVVKYFTTTIWRE